MAKLNLSFTRVTAPISGKVGRALLTPGNLAVADTTLLATIVSVDPMDVSFDVDERTLVRLRREEKGKAERNAEVPVLLALPDDEGFVHHGKLEGIDVRVNPNTGAAHWRAVFANPDGLFLPGMFARVRVLTGAPHKALLVPDSAVVAHQGQKFVFVVTGKEVVEERPVKMGPEDGGLRVVKEGLTAEDRFIIDLDGSQRHGVRAGMKVQPKEVSAPTPKDQHKPQESSPNGEEP